jgi:hypothetical protein
MLQSIPALKNAAAAVAAITIITASAVLLHGATTSGREFYASPAGASSGNGSISSPLDLRTALSSNGPLRPGDTLWLRGGRYMGPLVSTLTGTAALPIIVRQYPGERVTLDGAGTSESTLTVKGGWTWYWGFEVMDSDTKRVTATAGSHPADLERGDGLAVFGPGVKLINLVVHDAADGIGFWTPAVNAEIHGLITYNNGWVGPDRGHGHGIYIQNDTGAKRIEDVISFNNFNTGMKAWAQSTYAVGVRFENIISFNNGSPTYMGSLDREPNIFVGATTNPLDAITVTRSMLYHPPDTDANMGGSVVLGYTAPSKAVTLTDSYIAGGRRAVNLQNWSSVTMTGNFVNGSLRGLTAATYPSNTYQTTRPSGVRVFVRPNRYESGRANIAIYNWALQTAVAVDLAAAGLTIGDAFEIRDAQDFYGEPIVSSTYTGAPVSVPMMGLTNAAPIGHNYNPPHTAPEFGAFVLLRTSGTDNPPAETQPDLDVRLTADDMTPTVGVPYTYRAELRNAGSAAAADPVGTLQVPASLTILSIAASQGTCTGSAPTVCRPGPMAAGSAMSISVRATPTAAATLTTTVSAGVVAGETITANNTAALTVSASAAPVETSAWVRITSPAANVVLAAGADLMITADAAAPTGVRKVAFYAGTRLMGADSTRPFSYKWSRVPAGTHTLVVKATDAAGAIVSTSMTLQVR